MARIKITRKSNKTKRTILITGIILIALTLFTQVAFQYKIIIRHFHRLQIQQNAILTNVKNLQRNGVGLTGNVVHFTPNANVYPVTLYENAYIIENKHYCDIGKDLTFLVIIHSAIDHFPLRNSIRGTWANKRILKFNDIRVVFLLGSGNSITQVRIEEEMALHGDIVQGNFIDTYHNLTHKAAMSVRWVSENCMNTKIIVKIDDDVFLPVFQYVQMAREVWSKQTKTIHCVNRVPVVNRKGRWKVEPEFFAGLEYYPFRTCMGFVQVMTADMFPSLYEAAKETPFFWIDDIYLSGILVERVGGVTFHKPNKTYHLTERQTLECYKPTTNESCDTFAGFTKTPGLTKEIWTNYLKVHSDLAEKYLPNK